MRNEENGAGTAVAAHLALMDEQRPRIFAELSEIWLADLWARPSRGKWSIGEHLDHTRVLNRT
jgi:hypothetical protein